MHPSFDATHSRGVPSNNDNLADSLPLEILAQISEDLDPGDIVRNQRVSKRWRSIFSSEAIMKSALRRSLLFLGLDSTDVAPNEAVTYLRWHHGLQSGRPVKKIFLPRSKPFRESQRGYYICESRQLCHVTYDNYRVEILDLEAGHRSSLVVDETQARFGDFLFYQFDSYLVSIEDDMRLTAWNIKTSERLVRWLPGSYQVVCGEKGKIVLIQKTWEDPASIAVWDLSMNQIREIGEYFDFGKPWLWHLEAEENMLVGFEFSWDTEPPEVRQTKWSLTGRLLDRKFFNLSLGRRLDDTRFSPHVRLSRTFGHKTITRLYLTKSGKFTMDLVYDYASDKLSLQWVDRRPRIDTRWTWDLLTPYISYEWDGYTNQLYIYDTTNGTTAMRSRHIDVPEVYESELLHEHGRQSNQLIIEGRDPGMQLFGNREVLCLAGDNVVQLWFFNPNFVPDLRDSTQFPTITEGSR